MPYDSMVAGKKKAVRASEILAKMFPRTSWHEAPGF